MNTTHPTDIYRQRIEAFLKEREKIAAQKNRIAWGRLVAVVAAVLAFYFLKNINIWLAILVALALVVVFFRLVAAALLIAQKLKNTDRLIAINQQEIEIAAGNYCSLPDGLQHLPALHPYAYDLDIFGRASLFQFLNRTTSQQGSRVLANWLLNAANRDIILQRQEAVKELSGQIDWRQQLQAHGMATEIFISTQQKIQQWLNEDDGYFSKPVWRIVRYIGPVISLTILALFIADIISTPAFNIALLLFFVITGFISKKATPVYHTLNKISPQIATLSSVIKHIEEISFKSVWLQEVQKKVLIPIPNHRHRLKL